MKLYFWINYSFIVFGHVLMYMLAGNFFRFSQAGAIILALVLAFLAISAPFSHWLLNKIDRDLWVLRAYYFLSAAWMGILLNLFLAALPAYFFRLAFPASADYVGFIWVSLALIAGFVGYFLGSFPHVREEEVCVEGLPDYWDGRVIAHVSDLHLGPIHRHRFFKRVLKLINSRGAFAIFVTGDLFDDVDLEFDWVGRLITESDFSGNIYYSFGNHDLMLGFDRVKSALSHEKMVILDDKAMCIEGLQLVGLNFSFDKDFHMSQSLLIAGYDKSLPSILLFHEPKLIDDARKAGICLELCGHTHRGQMFPINWITRLFYKGYDRGMHKKENFFLSVCAGTGTWGPPFRTNSRSEIVAITLRKKISSY